MQTAPTLGVITTDRELAIRGWNERIATATGRAEHDVIGQPLLDFVAPERAAFYRDLLSEIVATGSARVLAPAFHHYLIRCALPVPSPHFEYMQQRVTIAPLTGEAAVVGLMITIEDVTARLERERQVAAILDPASPERRTEALASDDWQVRGEAVRQLKRSASVDELRHLLDTLHRDHHDLNVLNSGLRVLIGAGRTVVEPLIELLGEPAANLRMHAALALGELQADEATPQLVAMLEDPDENVRFHVIEALGRIGTPESIEPLARIAASDNFFLAFAAIEALSKTDDARVAPLMVSLLDNEMLRPAAISTLAAIGDEDSIPALGRALDRADGQAGPIAAAMVAIHRRYDDHLGAGGFVVDTAREAVTPAGHQELIQATGAGQADRAAAATVLAWMGRVALTPLVALVGDEPLHASIAGGIVAIGTEAIAPLSERLNSASPQARIAAAELLGRIGDRRATAALVTALSDTEADVAAAAAAALGGVGDPGALDGLVGLFGHPSATVRRAAIAAINAIGADGTANRVRAASSSDDPRVRESAVRVAGYFGFEDAVPAIIAALDDATEDVRRAAIEQVPVLDQCDAAGILTVALAKETPRNRAAAAHALRQVDDPRTGAALREALGDPDVWVRYYAALSLGQLHFGAGYAEDLAQLARHDPATHVRIAAITSLGMLSPQLAARAATDLLDDPDDDLAIAAVKVLGSIPRAEAYALLERAVRSTRPVLQLAVVRAFASRPSPEAVEALAWAARVDDVASLAYEAIDSLRHIAMAADHPIAQRSAVAALRDLAARGDRRSDVVGAIARLPEFVVPELASGLSDGRVGVRVATVDALAAMRLPRASSELARALRDENPAVRAAAVAGFARLGTPAVARIIATMRQTDPDEGVRRRAELACTRHGWAAGPVARQ
jgi:HEAT repeat protein